MASSKENKMEEQPKKPEVDEVILSLVCVSLAKQRGVLIGQQRQ
jgi:hypothetical protein